MARKKEEPRWITGKEATAILRTNSGRDDIPDSYIRTLARANRVATMSLDGRTNGYLLSDVEGCVIKRRSRARKEVQA